MDVIGWALTVNSIVGALLNARKRVEGFYLWAVGNAGWIAWSLYHKIYPQAVLWTVYLLITIYGIIKWRKLSNEEETDWNNFGNLHSILIHRDGEYCEQYMQLPKSRHSDSDTG